MHLKAEMANKFSFTLNSGSVMPALGFGTYAPQHVSKTRRPILTRVLYQVICLF